MLIIKLVFGIQSLRYHCSTLHDAFSDGKLLLGKVLIKFSRPVPQNVTSKDYVSC